MFDGVAHEWFNPPARVARSMTAVRDFCPRCGEPIAPGEGIPSEGDRAAREAELCPSCYFEEFELVSLPAEMTLVVCASCGAVQRDGEWTDVEADDYTDVVIERLGEEVQVHRYAREVSWTVQPIQRGPNELTLEVLVEALVRDRPVRENHTVRARIARETCQRCGRIAGDYYAGTVQVRANERDPTTAETDRAVEIAHEVVDRMRETGNRSAFVSEVIERPEGVDIRVSTNRIGDQIAARITEEFGGEVSASETLVTEDADGEGVYRVAYAVRLPRFVRGDLVTSRETRGPVVVLGANEAIRGRELATGEEVSIDDSTELTAVGDLDDVRETTLVTVEDAHSMQVLDPDSHAAVTIPRPVDAHDVPGTVHVVRSNAELFYVPPALLDSLTDT